MKGKQVKSNLTQIEKRMFTNLEPKQNLLHRYVFFLSFNKKVIGLLF